MNILLDRDSRGNSPAESPTCARRSVDLPFELCDKTGWIYRGPETNMKNAKWMIWFLCALMPSLWQAGCQTRLPVTEQAYVEEVRFRSAWDYAIDRLSYHEVVRSWGAPTSLLSGFSPQGSESDGAPIRANWHWNHSVTLTPPISPEDGNLMFGQRMELVFNRATKLLMDWKYWEWGPSARSYEHRLSSPTADGIRSR